MTALAGSVTTGTDTGTDSVRHRSGECLTGMESGRCPRYRLLSVLDDASFCRRVSEALDPGHRLHGCPTATFDGSNVIAAPAVVWSGDERPPLVDPTGGA